MSVTEEALQWSRAEVTDESRSACAANLGRWRSLSGSCSDYSATSAYELLRELADKVLGRAGEPEEEVASIDCPHPQGDGVADFAHALAALGFSYHRFPTFPASVGWTEMKGELNATVAGDGVAAWRLSVAPDSSVHSVLPPHAPTLESVWASASAHLAGRLEIQPIAEVEAILLV